LLGRRLSKPTRIQPQFGGPRYNRAGRPLLFRRRLVGFGWCQRQFGSSAEHLSFVRRELLLVVVGIDLPLTRLGRHSTQRLDRILYRPLPFRRELLHLRMQVASLLFLPRGEMLPGFHPVQHLLLLLRWNAVEVLQLVAQLLLPLRRKITELRVVFQRFSLLLGRLVFVLTQPLSRMMLLRRLLLRSLLLRSLLLRSLRRPVLLGRPLLRVPCGMLMVLRGQ
jgi:hypothetical protein